MQVRFIGNSLTFTGNGGVTETIRRGWEGSIPEDLPRGVWKRYVHRFRILSDAPAPTPVARVVIPAGITHVGAGWYQVEGVDGNYRGLEAAVEAQQAGMDGDEDAGSDDQLRAAESPEDSDTQELSDGRDSPGSH